MSLNPVPIPLQIFSLIGNKWCNLQQDDVTGLYRASTPSPFTFTPTPTFRASCWTASHPSIRPAFLSLGTRLHYRDELSYCEDPTAPSHRRGWSLAGHRGIMRWPGFRGQFTHCLKSISRNASLDDCPLFSAKGPLTATPSINALNIFVQLLQYLLSVHLWTSHIC